LPFNAAGLSRSFYFATNALAPASKTRVHVVESRFNFAGKVDLFASRPLQSEKIGS